MHWIGTKWMIGMPQSTPISLKGEISLSVWDYIWTRQKMSESDEDSYHTDKCYQNKYKFN